MTRQTWYRIAIAILVLGEGYLVVSGRLAASYRFTSAAPATPSEAEFFHHFLTNVLWIAFLAPLAGTVVWLATRDKSATAGAAYWRAIRTVFTVAWKGDAAPPLEEATDTVEEDPLGALLKGVAAAALMPSFFWFAAVPIRDLPKLDVGIGHLERLGVRVHSRELDALEAGVHHAVDRIGSAAAYVFTPIQSRE